MIETTLTIQNKLGLHARASSALMGLAIKFVSKSDLTVKTSQLHANCKSIMGLMMLAASYGTIVTLTVEGADEILAANAIIDLINNKFGENN